MGQHKLRAVDGPRHIDLMAENMVRTLLQQRCSLLHEAPEGGQACARADHDNGRCAVARQPEAAVSHKDRDM
jgi:hypothetical protein